MDELTASEARALLASEKVAHIATAAGGEPYVTPISFVIQGDELVFRTVPGRRLDAISVNPRVCIEASTTDEVGNWKSVLVFGDAYFVADADREAEAVAALLEKYSDAAESLLSMAPARPFDPQPVLVAVPLADISGRSSGTGLNPRTRPGRL